MDKVQWLSPLREQHQISTGVIEMRKRNQPIIWFMVALFTLFTALVGDCTASEKPNIVYILVDNWGWGDISIQGSSVSTPRIDKLAKEGIRFTNFNVQNQCTPTRSAIHTGRLPIRSGTWKVAAPGEPQGMAPWEYTIAELLSDAGYATSMYGKWHIGDKDGRLPNDQGYDEWYGTKESAMEASFTSTPQFDPKVFPIPHIWAGTKGEKSTKVKPFDLKSRALLDREIVEKTADFIQVQAKKGEPFFVYAALTHIHPPFLPHPDFKGKSKAGAYADIQMEVDYNVGYILDAIRKAGIEKNTILILTGDNAAGEDTDEGGSNGPWRGGLSTGYEGGTRTVGMIRWPDKFASDTVTDEIFADLDWFPTLAHLVGEEIRIPKDRPIDGINQADFLLGKQKKSNRDYVVTYVGERVFAVKWRSLKIHFFTAESTFAPIVEHTFPQVYDIKNDPDEKAELWKKEGYAHLWVTKPVMEILTKLKKSMAKYPNIKPGQDFTGYR
jgi:arylsulfatase A-like enzyme